MSKSIVHSVDTWLSPTSYWIFEQTQALDIFEQQIWANTIVPNSPKQLKVTKVNKADNSLLSKLNLKLNKIKDYNRLRLVGSLDNFKDAIIFSHFGTRGYYDLGLGFKKHIVRFYGFDVTRIIHQNKAWKKRYQELFNNANLFLVEGPFMRSELINLGCSASKIQVLPLGIHPTKLTFKNRTFDGIFHIITAGVFKEKKGILTALTLVDKLIKNGLKIKMHLVGDLLNDTENDRKYAIAVQQRIELLTKQNAIHHYGFLSKNELLQVASKCHLALQPSQLSQDKDSEGGYPLTFLEMMQTGTPVLSYNHADIPFIINEGENGFLASEYNEQQLEDKLLHFIDNYNDSIHKTTTDSVSKFYWSNLQDRYQQILSSI